MKSNKTPLSFEECTHPFCTTFLKSNGGPYSGFYVSVNSDTTCYPLNVLVEVAGSHYEVIKETNQKSGGIYYNVKEHDYDPFI